MRAHATPAPIWFVIAIGAAFGLGVFVKTESELYHTPTPVTYTSAALDNRQEYALAIPEMWVTGRQTITLCGDGYRIGIPDHVRWDGVAIGDGDKVHCLPEPREIDHYGR